MTEKTKSYMFVLGQWISFAAILATGPIVATNPFLFILEALAVALGVWAIGTMASKTVFNVTPNVNKKAHLVVSGPYRFIRHPMYAAVTLGFGALVINTPSLVRFLFLGLLVVVHIVKLRYEEQLLRERFPEYEAYQKKTARLIPFIY